MRPRRPTNADELQRFVGQRLDAFTYEVPAGDPTLPAGALKKLRRIPPFQARVLEAELVAGILDRFRLVKPRRP